MAGNLRIDLDRLMSRIERLGRVGALPGGGVKRLALSDADRAGRDLVSGWMRELGLAVTTDRIGNVWGVRAGVAEDPGGEEGAPVAVGSHIDTVATGGLYDGNLGVLAGLEIIETLNDAGLRTRRPVAVGFFTNEEGARFAPDMMGSGVAQGALDLEAMLNADGIDGTRVGGELERIGYAGDAEPGAVRPHAFLELHIEQGPVLEREGISIGAVTGVQGISWTEFTISGVSNHAGTTPMALRHDAGVVATGIAQEAHTIACDFGSPQVATVGAISFEPGLVNVVPRKAVLTVDLRNTDNDLLIRAETRLMEKARAMAEAQGCELSTRSMARFDPVEFDDDLIGRIERTARTHGHSVRRMPSGAGHDAQMFAPNCPTAMVFIPSENGLSHNVKEYSSPEEIRAGADVLFDVVLSLAEPASESAGANAASEKEASA